MTIQQIQSGNTQGLQVRVFRAGKTYTRFMAFKKHGGKKKARELAIRTEKNMEESLGPPPPARKLGDHAKKPNRNTSTGVPGVRAFYLKTAKRKKTVLYFTAYWRTWKGGKRVTGTLQRSADEHGILGALGQVLRAREAGSGIPMPTPRAAWIIIKKKINY